MPESPVSARKTPRPLSAFRRAEAMSHDLSQLPGKGPSYFDDVKLAGLLSKESIEEQIQWLRRLDVDSYIQRVVNPSENQKRLSSAEVIQQLGGNLIQEEIEGPLYLAEVEFQIGALKRRIGFVAQDHRTQHGTWDPKHHRRAADKLGFFAIHGMPVVTFIDTPGAVATAEANLDNQSHSISFLIAEMANLQLPTVGIVFGAGYSGGAIPLATTNVLLATKDGVFNTIHPKGLSNIARKYNLSWQECAKFMGVSSYELYSSGYFDGIIDFSLDQPGKISNLREAILSGIETTEQNARLFLKENSFLFDHYKENIGHYLNPSELQIVANRRTHKPPTGTLNVFGSAYRFMRGVKMRQKIQSESLKNYSRLSSKTAKTPIGTLTERIEQERQEKFKKWLQAPIELRYQEELNKRYQRFLETKAERDVERTKLFAFFVGDPKDNFEKALEELTLEVLIYLYNFWKDSTRENMIQLHDFLQEATLSEIHENPTLLDVLLVPEVNQSLQQNFQNILLFDMLYDGVIESLPMIAGELKGTNHISQQSVEKLFENSFNIALKEFEKMELQLEGDWVRQSFFKWLAQFIAQKNCDTVMATISGWKRIVYPRMSPPLFGVVRYYFSGLLPSLYKAQLGESKFQGKITPRNIGIKDFWNRLDQAYKDLLIQNLLRDYKKNHIEPKQILDKYFANFKELNAEKITANPVNFPGFRQAIEQALDGGIAPCGIVTGIANFTDNRATTKVGLVLSNTRFQAGAFDMASCEKVCLLLDECAQRNLPVIFFISSAGMQTKEGAGSLFSMATMNDRLTRFVKDHDLPVICFGFRDCVGGAQASFVTHLLVKTYYLSGAQIPFAGQLVVESHLPASSTLANYLSQKDGTMDGLVENPFDEQIDHALRQIDPSIPMPKLSIQEVISRTLTGEYNLSTQLDQEVESLEKSELMQSDIKRVLVHARGCTAARLIQASQEHGLEVVLVQSDPDMESYPAQLLRENDRLVCLGGNTPQESYLNAMSVIRIAEIEGVDAIHPGIGFLSESPQYARICREHGLNFIGPRSDNMDLMGNKSNAINTAKRLKIPVVPGSEGALANSSEASNVAEDIGYPVLIKAAHGGGGKGIAVVEQPGQLEPMFIRMSKEALNAFGNGDLYLEKFIRSLRHLEVQVLRDLLGNSHLLGIRDCSVQRNYQKLIEESAFDLPQKIQDQLFKYSRKLIDEIDYVGAGTVEFIYDLGEQKIYFMEMNTRLQVEHPVSEMVTGVDLVNQQFSVAKGNSLEGLEVRPNGHAMELRINAERVDLDSSGSLRFVPDPGRVTEAYFPAEENIRVIQAVTNGSMVPPFYDSLVAQIIAWGEDRKEAIELLLDYLSRVKIHGISTNLVLAKRILQDQDFQEGNFDTRYLKGLFSRISPQELIKESKLEAGGAANSLDESSVRFENSKEWKILSPQMGGFYRSPSPETPALVEEGSVINLQTPLCLLESMKVFNEISLNSFKTLDGKSLYPEDQQFRITRVLAEDQQTVNQGDLLFVMESITPN